MIGLGVDPVKAFDSADWATICEYYQKHAGAGKFCHNYLIGRTYTFEDIVGFLKEPMGSGVIPGSLLGQGVPRGGFLPPRRAAYRVKPRGTR